MKICGIITEYNPFHNGHLRQIQLIKEQLEADYVITAMSGDYVQRGLPAICDKHSRAEMALRNGADLVLELPVSIATASAELFAMGGVTLLDRLSVCTHLCFGCETEDMDSLEKIALTLAAEPKEYRLLLKEALKGGLSYPSARSLALVQYLGDMDINIEGILNSPNNILGIEYRKALYRRGSSIRPYPILREGLGYHDAAIDSDVLPSATAIRQLLLDSSSSFSSLDTALPKASREILTNLLSSSNLMPENAFDSILFYRLMEETPETLINFQDVTPDLANKIMKNRNQYRGFKEFALLLKSKELTYTRICRALLHICLKIEKETPEISYARILGFRRESSELLKLIKQNSEIPLVTKLPQAKKILPEDALRVLEKNVFCSNIYEGILSGKTGRPFVHEFEKQILIV